jgi:RNA polymerase sigma factor (TIGR02999 family)
MRRILVDYARSHRYAKRGGGVRPDVLEEGLVKSDDNLAVLVEIDLALQRLEALAPRQCQVVELRYFGGLSVEETAEALNISTITVIRDWNFARAWLLRELGGTSTSESGTPAAD